MEIGCGASLPEGVAGEKFNFEFDYMYGIFEAIFFHIS